MNYDQEILNLIKAQRVKFMNRFDLLQNDFKKLNDKIESIEKETVDIHKKNEHVLNIVETKIIKPTDEPKIDALLKTDKIDNSLLLKYYVDRRDVEKEITNFCLDKLNDKNVIVLHELSGMGKTTLIQYVCKRLINNYNYKIKWFNPDPTEIVNKYIDILNNELNYHISPDENIIDALNNELTKLPKYLNILFVFDGLSIQDENEIRKYLVGLPKWIKVIITTRNSLFLNDYEASLKIKLKPFDKEKAIEYLNKFDHVKNKFSQKDNIDKLLKANKITPFKLNFLVELDQNNLMIDDLIKMSNEHEYNNLIGDYFDNQTKIKEFITYCSYLDTSLLAEQTMNQIFNINRTDLNYLFDNGLIDIFKNNGEFTTDSFEINKILIYLMEFKQLSTRNDIKLKILLNIYELHFKNKLTSVEQFDLANVLSSIGDCYFKLNKLEMSMNYCKQSIEIYKKLKQTKLINRNMGLIYSELGLICRNMNEHGKSIKFYELSLEKFKLICDQDQDHLLVIAYVFNNMAANYFYLNQHSKSHECMDKSKNILVNVHKDDPNNSDILQILRNKECLKPKKKSKFFNSFC